MLDYAHERVLQQHGACPDRQNNTKGSKPVINIPSWTSLSEQKINTDHGKDIYLLTAITIKLKGKDLDNFSGQRRKDRDACGLVRLKQWIKK